MFVGNRSILLPPKYPHDAVAHSVFRPAGLHDFTDGEGTHRFADRHLRPISADVTDPTTHRRIGREVVIANQDFTFLNLRNLGIAQRKILRLWNASRSRAQIDLTIEFLRHAQKRTMSRPFSPKMLRASSGEATSRESGSKIERIKLTCSALDVASFPFPA